MSENVLLMSLSGSAVFLLWGLLSRLAGGRFGARWQYAAMKLVLLFLLIPVGPCLQWLGELWPAAAEVSAGTAAPLPDGKLTAAVMGAVPTTVLPDTPQVVISPTVHQAVLLLWGICAVAILAYKCGRFLKFRHMLQKNGLEEPSEEMRAVLRACRQELGMHRPVRLWISAAAPVPFASGLVHPVIVLPKRECSQQELQYILLHELTHITCGDLWVRWLAMVASAIHWWNPLIYLWNRKLVMYSEESCDERVVVNWPSRERGDYGRVLLKTACASVMPEGLTASISTTKLLQRRLLNMLRAKKVTRKQKMLAVAVLLALGICGSAAAFAIQSPVAVGEETTHETDRLDSSAAAQQVPPDGSGNAPVEPSKEETTEPLLEEQTGQEDGQASSAAEPEKPAAGQETKPDVEEEPEEQPIPEEYQNALRGDAQLILARGGTLLPDDDPEAYCKINGVYYKQFAAKGSTADVWYMMTEYEVGNWDLLSPIEQKIAKETLVDGEYPKNSSGESYGGTMLAEYVGYAPDLVSAQGTQGESGYIRDAEIDALPNLPKEECPHTFTVPLYDSEGRVIGEFAVSCGGHYSETMTLEEARAAALEGSVDW